MHNRSLALALFGAMALNGGAAYHAVQTEMIPNNAVAVRDPGRGAVARRGTRGSRRIAAYKRKKNKVRNGS